LWKRSHCGNAAAILKELPSTNTSDVSSVNFEKPISGERVEFDLRNVCTVERKVLLYVTNKLNSLKTRKAYSSFLFGGKRGLRIH